MENNFLESIVNVKRNIELTLKFKTETTVTNDGFNLVLAHYPNLGKQPIILMHGLALNWRTWDFPIGGPSFARFLHKKGYDVWIACLRHHEGGIIKRDKLNDWSWNIDDLAIYDIPAIIKKVKNETGKAPIWIGHSLGGMLAYMYLEGVTYKEATDFNIYKEETNIFRKKHAQGCDVLSEKRNQDLKGLITLGTPVALKWKSLNIKDYFNSFWETNVTFPLLNRLKIMKDVLMRFNHLPAGSFYQYLTKEVKKIPYLGEIFQKIINSYIFKVADSYFTSIFWYPPNMNKKTIESLIQWVLNDISMSVIEQLSDWVENKTFRAYPENNPNPFVYKENFNKIKLPTLIITGNKDKIACSKTVYEEGYQLIGSEEKSFFCFDNFGHNDLCLGISAKDKVFPYIENWIKRYGI